MSDTNTLKIYIFKLKHLEKKKKYARSRAARRCMCAICKHTVAENVWIKNIYAKKLIFFTLQIKHAHSKWNINNKHFMFFRAEFWCMTFPRNAFIIYGFVGRAGNASDVDYFTIMTIFIFKKNAFNFLTVCSSGRIIKKKKNYAPTFYYISIIELWSSSCGRAEFGRKCLVLLWWIWVFSRIQKIGELMKFENVNKTFM